MIFFELFPVLGKMPVQCSGKFPAADSLAGFNDAAGAPINDFNFNRHGLAFRYTRVDRIGPSPKGLTRIKGSRIQSPGPLTPVARQPLLPTYWNNKHQEKMRFIHHGRCRQTPVMPSKAPAIKVVMKNLNPCLAGPAFAREPSRFKPLSSTAGRVPCS